MRSEGLVWVFDGESNRYPSAVFSTRALAEAWIARLELSGKLTAYRVDECAYDWSMRLGYRTPKRDEPRSAEPVQPARSAAQEHYHYKDGVGE